jgi:cytochrome c oxidase subunit 2
MQLVLLASVMVTMGLVSPVARSEAAPQRIEITAKRFQFEPGEITLKKGQPVVLVLKSADVAHGIRIRDLNVDVRSAFHAGQDWGFHRSLLCVLWQRAWLDDLQSARRGIVL